MNRATAVLLGTLVLLASTHAVADLRTVAIVKLFSQGEMVASYRAVSRGELSGNCYVFRVRNGVREPEVIVCGDYSVEFVR